MNTLLLLTCLLLEAGRLLDTCERRRARRTPPPEKPRAEAEQRAAEAIERFNNGIAGILSYDARKGREEP